MLRHVFLAALLLLFIFDLDAAAQTPWQMTVDGGWTMSSSSDAAAVSLPAGTPFTTVVGRPSRQVPTWFAGDGAQLLNDVLGQLSVASANRVTPLDDLLGRSLTDTGKSSLSVGVRVSRALSPRVSLEGAVEFDTASLSVSDEASTAIEASRASFASAISALIATGPFSGPQVAATANVTDGSVRQMTLGGSLVVDLASGGTVVPYFSAGGGIVSSIGTAPTVTLNGGYSFNVTDSGARIAETDVATVSTTTPATPAALLGVGVRVGQGSWGLRLEARARISEQRVDTTFSATPAVATAAPADTIASFTTPSLQFSNNTAAFSTLSGAPLNTTIRSSSVQVVPRVSAGLFFRF